MQSHTTFSSATEPTFQHLSRAELRAVKSLKSEYQSLVLETEKVKKDLQTAQHNFNYLSGQKDIDACIFKIRTDQCRYESLLSRLQDMQDRISNLAKNSD